MALKTLHYHLVIHFNSSVLVMDCCSTKVLSHYIFCQEHTHFQRIFLLCYGIDEVKISPFSHYQEELIECYSRSDIVFQNIQDLNIFSLNFTSCTIKINSTVRVVITRCVFTDSKENYAIAIVNRSKRITMNISINTSKFVSNNGAICCNFEIFSLAHTRTRSFQSWTHCFWVTAEQV